MRILHVIPMLDPRAGGPPAVVLRIAAGQAALGHSVFLAHPPVAPEREADTLKSYQSIPGIGAVTFVPFDPRFSNILGRLRRVGQTASQFSRRRVFSGHSGTPMSPVTPKG